MLPAFQLSMGSETSYGLPYIGEVVLMGDVPWVSIFIHDTSGSSRSIAELAFLGSKIRLAQKYPRRCLEGT